MPIFECRALEKRYGAAMALDHIDLALEPGRIVGLLGPNGSGKSTLIKIAMGLLQPTSGELLIDGHTPSPQTNAIVSYLPDRVTLSPWMKTRQLLDFYGDFFADFDREAAERMLSQLGLNLNQSVRQIAQECRETYFKYYDLLKAFYWFSNPIVIKAALNILGLPAGGLREPYQPLGGKKLEDLRQILTDYGVIEKYGVH